MLLCYITDRSQFPGDESTRRRRLLEKIAGAAKAGVDYIQVREKDLGGRDLEGLLTEAVGIVRSLGAKSRLLVNSRVDIAITAGADGVNLRSEDIAPSDAFSVWRASWAYREGMIAKGPIIGQSCHTAEQVQRAAASGASLALFGPVFEKSSNANARRTGLEPLKAACICELPVLALGGVTVENAKACMGVGAAGIAAIRLFQNNEIETVVNALQRF